jgi:hypothetical protein
MVSRQLEMMFRTEAHPRHVWAYGFHKLDDRESGLRIRNVFGVECSHPNSVVDLFLGDIWSTIHERIGDDLFWYIITHTMTFVALPNNSYMQVTGYMHFLIDLTFKSSTFSLSDSIDWTLSWLVIYMYACMYVCVCVGVHCHFWSKKVGLDFDMRCMSLKKRDYILGDLIYT